MTEARWQSWSWLTDWRVWPVIGQSAGQKYCIQPYWLQWRNVCLWSGSIIDIIPGIVCEMTRPRGKALLAVYYWRIGQRGILSVSAGGGLSTTYVLCGGIGNRSGGEHQRRSLTEADPAVVAWWRISRLKYCIDCIIYQWLLCSQPVLWPSAASWPQYCQSCCNQRRGVISGPWRYSIVAIDGVFSSQCVLWLKAIICILTKAWSVLPQ